MAGRLFFLFSVMVLSVGLTTSCSNADESKKAMVASIDSEPVTLNFVGLDTSDDGSNGTYGEDLKKRFPNYTINFLMREANGDVTDKIASGVQLDIVGTSIGEELASVINPNLQYDIADLLKKHQIDLSSFDPAPIDAMKTLTGGKLYGLPMLNNMLVMYYNKDLFDKFGVPYPKDGMIWDDVIALAQKMTRTDGGKSYLGLAVADGHVIQLNQLSLPLVDPKTKKATALDEGWKRIYQTIFIDPANNPTYQDWINSNKSKLPGKKQFYVDKNLAMLIDNYTLFSGKQDDFAGLNWNMVALPVFKDKPGIGSQVYPKYLNITSTSKYKDQTMEVLKYMTSEEYQMEKSRQGNLTVLKNEQIKQALGSATQYKGINLKAVANNKVAPASTKSVYDDVVLDEFEKVLTDVTTGNTDLNTALRSVQEAADKAIAEKQ